LAIRSRNHINWTELTRACADADIAIADRRLPRGCNPRWLTLDRAELARTGGVAVYLGARPQVATVTDRIGSHPWNQAAALKSSTSAGAGRSPANSIPN